LGEYEFTVHHRPGKSNIIGVPDGLSRMLLLYRTKAFAKDSKRFDGIEIVATVVNGEPSQLIVNIPLITQEEKDRYATVEDTPISDPISIDKDKSLAKGDAMPEHSRLGTENGFRVQPDGTSEYIRP